VNKRAIQSLALACACTLGALLTPIRPAVAEWTEAQDSRPTVAQPSSPSARTKLNDACSIAADAERYANRERTTPNLSKFRGGDTVVISASAIAIALAVVLVLVLI
jgi:hypothetical protein